MAISAKDHLEHLADVDADRLSDLYTTVPARDFDKALQAAWYAAADVIGLLRTDRDCRRHYEDAVLIECRRIADATFRSQRQECYFCGKNVWTERAVAEQWVPSFWLTEATPANAPCCPACAIDRLTDLAGDPIVKVPDQG